ncbi:GIY-YIG nuclease family protein [Lysinibacillus sp. 54212]|uniref:GIY-YIG nuclease family protein n=1 Tax=Lysinibacillus sp. 54212 TaxID=3119829 RepID=UPI002FC7DBC4
MEKSKHYFYVVECRDDSFYAGYTNNLEKRLAAHNAGKGAKYTRARLPVTCIHYEIFESKQEAMRMEYAFKQFTREKKEQYIGRASCESTKE